MAEIELSVLAEQCLDRRLADQATLQREVVVWEAARNASGRRPPKRAFQYDPPLDARTARAG